MNIKNGKITVYSLATPLLTCVLVGSIGLNIVQGSLNQKLEKSNNEYAKALTQYTTDLSKNDFVLSENCEYCFVRITPTEDKRLNSEYIWVSSDEFEQFYSSKEWSYTNNQRAVKTEEYIASKAK